MKPLITLGKLITLFAWGVMLYNLVMPFEGQISTILNILLVVTCVMHGIQVLIFHSLFKALMELNAKAHFSVFLFGVFSLLEYRQAVLNKMQ